MLGWKPHKKSRISRTLSINQNKQAVVVSIEGRSFICIYGAAVMAFCGPFYNGGDKEQNGVTCGEGG
jgi:hypothetical protein